MSHFDKMKKFDGAAGLELLYNHIGPEENFCRDSLHILCKFNQLFLMVFGEAWTLFVAFPQTGFIFPLRFLPSAALTHCGLI